MPQAKMYHVYIYPRPSMHWVVFKAMRLCLDSALIKKPTR